MLYGLWNLKINKQFLLTVILLGLHGLAHGSEAELRDNPWLPLHEEVCVVEAVPSSDFAAIPVFEDELKMKVFIKRKERVGHEVLLHGNMTWEDLEYALTRIECKPEDRVHDAWFREDFRDSEIVKYVPKRFTCIDLLVVAKIRFNHFCKTQCDHIYIDLTEVRGRQLKDFPEMMGCLCNPKLSKSLNLTIDEKKVFCLALTIS